MTSTLQLAPNLELTLDAVTQRFAWLGRIGSGKTYAATKLLELMLEAGAQVVALDPVGKCYGLRVPGKGPGFQIPVFGGLHGDVPLEATGGALIADIIVDRGISCVIDVSQFETDTDKARFAAAFADRFFFRKKAHPSAVFVFLEECQEFVPQNTAKGEEMMLHYWTRMAKLGRNFGIGLGLASQRPQEVNKKVLNLTEVMFAFQLRGKHERAAVADWITEKDGDESILKELPKLPVGVAYCDSPQWLGFSDRVKVYEKRTADVSATPKVGESTVAERPLTAVDLGQLRESMAATIEKAKENDPKLLKKRIVELESQVGEVQASMGQEKATRDELEARYHAGFTDGKAEGRRSLVGAFAATASLLEQQANLSSERAASVYQIANNLVREIREARDGGVSTNSRHCEECDRRALCDMILPGTGPCGRNTGTPAPSPDATMSGRAILARAEQADNFRMGREWIERDQRARVVVPDEQQAVKSPRDNGVTGVEQRILNTLRGLEVLGVTPVDKPTAAALVGYHPNAKSYANALGSLRTKAMVEYPGDGTVALTKAGRSLSENALPVKSLRELHSTWIARLGNVGAKILEPLIKLYPRSAESSYIASLAGYHPNSKSFANMKGRLRTLGLIDYPRPGYMAATAILFPEGLK